MNGKFTFKEVKSRIEIRQYLASLGHHAVRQNGVDVWYKSPFHEESTPSFKVNKKHQIWYDHSLGIGGDLIDFGRKYHGCSLVELLEKFKGFLSFQPDITQQAKHSTAQNEDIPSNSAKKRIKIVASRTIFKFYLKSYLASRGIPLDLANQYLKEVDYTNSDGREDNNKIYTALGFKNDKGGFELRSKYFKGSSAPKSTTFMTNLTDSEARIRPIEEQSIAVFEGFFSFLSFQSLWFHNRLEAPLPDNFLVLNSLSFFRKNFEFMEAFKAQMLFLDNDNSGKSATAEAVGRQKNYIDYSNMYGEAKDLNALLTSLNQSQSDQMDRGGRKI